MPLGSHCLQSFSTPGPISTRLNTRCNNIPYCRNILCVNASHAIAKLSSSSEPRALRPCLAHVCFQSHAAWLVCLRRTHEGHQMHCCQPPLPEAIHTKSIQVVCGLKKKTIKKWCQRKNATFQCEKWEKVYSLLVTALNKRHVTMGMNKR